MNETAIVKFLAEQMGWNVALDEIEQREFYYAKGKSVDVEDIPFEFYVDEFDPMNDISHAFIAREAFGAKVVAVFKESPWDAGKLHDSFEEAISRDNDYLNVTPRDYCIAIARTLATDEQIVEFGL